MPKRVCVPAVLVGLSATAIVLSSHCATLAADDCLAAPNRPPAPGGHWYFHVDRANANRKCWYLTEPGTRAPTGEAPTPQPIEASATQPMFGSFFSLMGLPGATSAPDTPSSAGRTPQNGRLDDVRNDETAPASQTRTTRRPDSQAALTPKPHRAASARAPVEHPEERPASPDQAERDALFQEFLRWRERNAQ